LILNRYINRQLFVTTVVVSFVLMMVLVSGRFIKYLAEAAAGEIAADILLLLLLFRLPEFLQMIVPLSMFVGVLLVFGRLSIDNELVVMRAGGASQLTNARGLFWPILVASALIALFSLYVTPRGDAEVTRLFEEQKNRSVLELLTPGRFFSKGYDNLQRSTYAEQVDREQGLLLNIFISEIRYGEADLPRQAVTVRADSGKLVQKDGHNYLELINGIQYQGVPGQGDFSEVGFARALMQVGEERVASRPPKVRGWTTQELLQSDKPSARAELQWRISLVLLVPVMCLAAVPLGQVNPRQGRFGKLIPGILAYMLYMGMLLVIRSRIADVPEAEQSVFLNMAWVHALAVVGVVLLYAWPGIVMRWRDRHAGAVS
jgi:lipopolysaccharide export system permease protein